MRFLPLGDGFVYAYDTRSDAAGRGLLVMQVSRPRHDRADLRVGSRVERLQLDAAGVAYSEGGFLLKAPLTLGARWRSRGGMVRVSGVDVAVRVPAGAFQGCIRTVEESQDPRGSKTVTSVYCPHVGLVSLDVEGETERGHDHEAALLRSFGPRVDLSADGSTTTSLGE